LRINELRIDQDGADDDEYFELFGGPATNLYGLSYVVIGDGFDSGSGVVETAVKLYDEWIPDDGFFLAVEETFTLRWLGEAQLVLHPARLNFENRDNVTHMLVFGFSAVVGADLDPDDDGTLDYEPWAGVIDCVAVLDEVGGGDKVYCGDTVGPVGGFTPAPGHVYRGPDAGSWSMGVMDPWTPSAADTPGWSNAQPPEPSILGVQSCRVHDDGGPLQAEVCILLGTGAGSGQRTSGDNVEPRVGGIRKLIVTVDGTAPPSPTASADCFPMPYAGTAVAFGGDPDDDQVTITFNPALPEGSCCELTMSQVSSQWWVAGLEGDCNRDGEVTPLEFAHVSLRLGQSASAEPEADINVDGQITPLDFAAISLRLANSIPACGAEPP
jgi:hypothetical protein